MANSSGNWFIIELSESGEESNFKEIESAVLNLFGDDSDYFIPVHHEKMGSYLSTFVLFDGYIFIKDSISSRKCLHDISDFRIFAGPLKTNGKIQTVDSYVIGSLRRKLHNSLKKKLKTGSKVKIMGGTFKGLEGVVISMEDGGRQATVRIKCLSREMIAPIPVTMVLEISEEETPSNKETSVDTGDMGLYDGVGETEETEFGYE